MTAIVRRKLFLAALLALPLPAMAQMSSSRPWFVSSTFGLNAGGETTTSSPAVGISGGWLGQHWLGVEGELAWTPGFFEQDGFRITRRMRTFMANALVQIPTGESVGLFPYAAGGFGVVSPHLTEAGNLFELKSNEPGFNVGGGAMWVKRGIGIRGDVRYYRMAGDDEPNSFGIDLSSYGFWRVSTGLVVKF